jgi:two-component system, NtrC family, sensor kinase
MTSQRNPALRPADAPITERRGDTPAPPPGSEDLRRHAAHREKLAELGKVVLGVAHELNNPVTSILAYTEYLIRKAGRGGLDRADIERLTRIQEAAERIRGFSRDLLAYARPSAEPPVPLSIHDVLERSLEFCEHILLPERFTIERAFADVPPVLGIDGQLAQVFVNLFTNAVNAMGEGGTLRVETSLHDTGRAIHVVVSDTGCGLSEESLSRIFEPFFTTRAGGGGTGLGLSIVRGIVESHRGRVWAERREGTGAAFHVTLPVAPDPPR